MKEEVIESGIIGNPPIKQFDWLLTDEEVNYIATNTQKLRDSMPSADELSDRLDKLSRDLK